MFKRIIPIAMAVIFFAALSSSPAWTTEPDPEGNLAAAPANEPEVKPAGNTSQDTPANELIPDQGRSSEKRIKLKKFLNKLLGEKEKDKSQP